MNKYGPIEKFPKDVLEEKHEQALLFKRLATLRTDAKLFKKVDQLRWTGPTSTFAGFSKKLGDAKLLARANELAKKLISHRE